MSEEIKEVVKEKIIYLPTRDIFFFEIFFLCCIVILILYMLEFFFKIPVSMAIVKGITIGIANA